MDDCCRMEPGGWQTVRSLHDCCLRRAQAARAQLLRNLVYTCAHRLRTRICATAERLRFSFCPLCCHS